MGSIRGTGGPGARPAEGTDVRRRPLGRRRRRLRIAAAAVALVALAALLLGFRSYLDARPQVRKPGEALPEITERLAGQTSGAAPTPRFTDVTAAAGLDGFRCFAGERTSQLPEDMGCGAAWGDFDGDGDEDLFLVAAGGSLSAPSETWARSRLYENLGDGTFREVTSFPETRILGMAAAWGDYDGDGDLDLAVSGYRELLLFRNEGEGRFVLDERFAVREGFWTSLAWVDFDGDGDLDLSVCGYVRYEPPIGDRRMTRQYDAAVPYTLNPASFEPESNLLLENLGDGRFVDVALEWGVSNPGGRSLGCLWHDFDDDGRPDLYVANDISDNALFLNRGDTFEDAALAAWVADYRGAMGLAVGDWNRDGDDDLFVTHWLAQENALYDSRLRDGGRLDPGVGLLAPEATADLPRLTFSDVSAPTGLGHVGLPLVGWGAEMVDFDADGWLDIVVVNGSTVEEKSDTRQLVPQLPQLMWNDGGGRFHDLAPRVPALTVPRVGRGLAVADYDGDGDLDLLITDLAGGVQLLRNDTPQGHSLQLRLRRTEGGFGHAEGATAVAWIGGVPLRRSVGGVSYLSQSTRTLHFGLGEAEQVDRLEVRWPDGTLDSFGPLAADRLWELRQGAGPPRAVRVFATPAVAERRPLSRQEVHAFWSLQRAGMDAMKRQDDVAAAADLFRQALALDPDHEDSRYYLAHALWAGGEPAAALAELGEMRRRSPGSHRAHRQWAAFAAGLATSEEELALAAAAAERAVEINGEDTGGLLLRGEIALLQGHLERAAEQFALACRSNPRAIDGLFLGAFVAWRQGDSGRAGELLAQAREALGPDWKPVGTVAEGDVVSRLHREETPLAHHWQQWDGSDDDPAATFAPLVADLAARGTARR